MEEKRNSPFFSVIVLAYQVEAFISECLNSILLQTFQDMEIIVVIPACNDKTESICEKYKLKDNRIQLIKKENEGQLLNRLAGFGIAKGKYLLCIDGDDWWKANLLEEIYKASERGSFDLIMFGYETVTADRVLNQQFHILQDGHVYKGKEKKIVYEMLVQEKINSIWTKAMTQEVFIRIKEDFSKYTSIRYGEDLLYCLYIIDEAKNILYMDQLLYCYRKREDSVVHTFSPRELEDKKIVILHVEKMMKKWNMTSVYYYEMLYKTVALFFMKFIFRCSTSNLSLVQKKNLLDAIRTDSLYLKSRNYQNKGPDFLKERFFVWLFRRSDILVLLSGSIYCIGKQSKNILKHIKEGF